MREKGKREEAQEEEEEEGEGQRRERERVRRAVDREDSVAVVVAAMLGRRGGLEY